MKAGDSWICSRCDKPGVVGDFIGGYAIDLEDKLVCFDCCAVEDRARLANTKPGDRLGGFYTFDKSREIGNWPGTLKVKCYSWYQRKVFSPVGGYISRTDARFEIDGRYFWARCQGDQDCCTVTRCKGE